MKISKYLFLTMLMAYTVFSQAGITVNGSSTLFLSNSAKLKINGDILLNTNSQFTQNTSDSIIISGNWTNNGTMTPNGGITLFNSGANQQIGGSSESRFYNLTVNKTAGNILSNGNVLIENNLRLLSNSLFNIADDTLTIGITGDIFTDNALAKNFSNVKSIYTSLGVNSGFLRKNIATNATLPYNFRFPLSTNGTPSDVYTYADITFILGKVTFNNGAYVQVKPVTTEHPALQISNNALKKYWTIEPKNIDISNQGVNLLFKYDQSEVTTNEGNYQVLEYAPPYPDGSAQWYVNPGASNQVVDINADLIYSEQVSVLKGDWTAGIEEAAIATYYSRQDGNFNDPNTWSKIGFGGPASTTAPSTGSDRARIKSNNITVNANSNKVANISIEDNATITFNGENYIAADSIIVKDEATLKITSSQGIDAGDTQGNMRSLNKSFSENAFYIYQGTDSLQFTGNGIPSSIRTLILNKSNSSKILEINKFISIKDSLVINDGILDIGNYSVNGASANKKLIMRGGELRIRNAFPSNYSAPYFTAGRINFWGSGSASIPTNATSPGVLQFNKLEVSGNRSGNITFPSNGQIKIADSLEIDSLFFSSTTYKFLTTGSTVIFNKNGGNQYIPTKPASPADSNNYLVYHNLILDSTGNKLLKDTGTPFYQVKGNLTIRNQATFGLNGYNIAVEGNWINQDAGSIFAPNTNTVMMRSPVTASTTNITSRDTTQNPFYNLVISGKGVVKPLDELKIRNNVRIDSNSTLLQQATNITLNGNWLNYYGNYTTNNATLYLNGSVTQTITKPNADENFDKLVLRNPTGVNIAGIGTTTDNGLNLNGDVTLDSGNIITGVRRVTALANVIRISPTPGHINGTLWKVIPTGASNTLYEVGTATSYTPVDFSVNGVAGNSGFVSIKADTITASSNPISNGLLPANSLMSDTRNVRRQWTIVKPSSSTFLLATRTYTPKFNFIATNDLRNGADPNFFEIRLWNSSSWVFPQKLGDPYIGARTNSSIKFFNTIQYGTYTIGEPSNYSFYSIANGNWTIPSNWSTERFGGAPTTIEPTIDANVYIGDNKSIIVNTNKTNNKLVNIDSTGVIDLTNNILQGTGEFRLNQYGKMLIGNTAGITTAGATGSVQMTTRQYNYNNHNKGIFEYTGTLAQNVGNGLPNNTFRLYVNKPSNTLTLATAGKTILDSLYLKSGTFSQTVQLNLRGNLRRSIGANYTPNTSIFQFEGDSTQYINDEATDSLLFYDIRIDKTSGNVVLENNSPLDIKNQLRFSTNNVGILYARKTGNYVIVENNVSRQGLGHVNGELIKNIPAGDAAEVTFEVGDTLYYSPFYLDMRAGTGSTAGYLSMNAVPGDYPYMGDAIITSTNPPIYPGRIVHRYWRLTKPAWSTFVRGNRNFDIRSEYRNSEDWEALDSYECADFAFNKHFGDTTNWESIWPSNAGICSDTRDVSRTPNFSNTAGVVGGTGNARVYTDVNNITKPWGTTKTLTDGSLLLGDFVLGNQNGKAQFITFYSRQSGNWTDASTWSTVSHSSNINVADTISPTINFRKFPLRQYDNVVIDSGDVVTLDASIGMGEYTSTGNPFRYLAKVGPNVLVKPKGTLDLGIFELRGNSFKAEKGATLIIGSADGVNSILSGTTLGKGNLKGYARAIEDSVNLIYTAKGINPDNPNRSFPYYHNYCTINMGDNSRYIRRVTVKQGATTIMTNSTGDSLINILSFQDFVATLTAGQSYTLEVEKEDNTNTRYLRAYIDWNRDGDWTDVGETIANINYPNNSTTATVNFTVPANTEAGYTQMRVIYRSNSNNTDPCTNSNGEAEDYSIVINNTNSNITQSTGTLVPNTISSIQIHSLRPTSQVNLSNPLTVIDSVKFISGVFNANGNNINLAGDIISDTVNAFNQGASLFTFYEGRDQNIRGTKALSLGAVTINKDSNDIFIKTNTNINGNTTVTSQTFLNIIDNDTLTFGNGSTLASGAGGFGVNRMIKVSGTPSISGVVRKQFNNAAGNQTFNFPIGVDTLFNPGFVTLNGTYTGIPLLSVQLINAQHPARLNDLILRKYWRVGQQNITSLGTSDIKFIYNSPEDTSGNASRYYAGIYLPTNQWEVNLGTAPTAYPDTIHSVNTSYFVGDWTAGESSAFFKGRNYYSRNTGNWDVPSNWSNVSHSGPPSSYSPGEITFQDTVFIDGHKISFNVDTASVDSITIGGAYAGVSTAGRGILEFAASPLDKQLTIKRSLFLDTDGRLQSAVQLGKVDTLTIRENLINNGLASNTSGIDLHNSTNDYVLLKFTDSTDSYISGTGSWDGLAKVRLDKTNGVLDTLFINSATLGAASSSFSDYGFELQSGILKHYNNYDFVAGNDGVGIDMKQFTGIVVTNGRLISNETVKTDVGNTIEVSGGEFVVGDESDENFIYQDNTSVHLNGGKMTVAGAFDGDFVGATVKLNIENNSELKVLSKGATDIGLVGFNVNAASQLDMASGRIIVANSIPGANADYKVNSTVGTGFTGGIVQIGDSTVSVGGSEIKVIGSTPIYNMHVVGNTITAKQTGANVTIRNNLEIDNNAVYDLSTNSIDIGGNITNYGLFDASNGNLADFRLLTLNGTGDQTIFNDDAPGMVLHNLTIDKASGNVKLSGNGNSNLVVHKTLEFTANNKAIIDGSANQFGSYVELTPSGGSNPTFLRNGKGHVYGRVYRYFPSTADEKVFPVGSDTLDSYRPATIKTVNSGNTAGLIGVAHYGKDHPDLDASLMNPVLNIQKYWNINTNGFALGVGNTYELKLDFLNPADIRNSANTSFFEQFMYDPACPNPPGSCPPGTGTWTELAAKNKTTTSIRTQQNSIYGDVVVGEPSGLTFFSIASGDWKLASNWSTSGYGGGPAARYPNQTSDIVRIGDGKRITMPAGISHDPVRAVIVEDVNAPGELYILGNTGNLKASSFLIEDNCTLAIGNVGGISDIITQGALQTNTKSFGVANYIFKSESASMITGKGFPDTLASMKVDISDANESVFTTNYGGALPMKVRDSIVVFNGKFESGNRDYRLYGDFDQYTNGLWKPLLGQFLIAGDNLKTLNIGNSAGLSFYDLDIYGGDISFNMLSSGGANTHLYVGNSLDLNDTTLIKVRTNDRKVILANGATVNRIGTGFVDGTMQRYFSSGVDSKEYAIGLNDIYTPVVVTTDNGSGGAAGGIDAIAKEPVAKEPVWGNRLDTNKRIERFWKISKGDTNIALGTRKFNTKFQFPPSELASIDINKSVVRRETLEPSTFPIWYQRKETELQWNVGVADVELAATTDLWLDFGNFYIGEKPRRIFYSNANGNWTDNNSWAMDVGGTILPPSGTYPNNDPTELEDSVVVDDFDEITLDTVPQITYLDLSENSKFIVGLGNYVSQSPIGLSKFDLTGGTIDNKSEFGIDSDPNLSWTRFTDKTIANDINFIFSGTTDQIFGNEFPTTLSNLTISNTGTSGDDFVAIGDNDYTINGDLNITDGDLRHSTNGNNLNLVGNLTTAVPLIMNLDTNGNSICSDFTLQGSGATNQTLNGPGSLAFCNLNMDRGAGAGIGQLLTSATVSGTMNLLTGANPNPQIFELGNNGNLSILNTAPSSIAGGSDSPLRYIRTSKTGGLLCRAVTTNGTYTWPVGSLEGGNDLYAPATLTTDATGTDGDICLKTNAGSNTNPIDAHNEVSSDANDYIGRYWEINSATTTITGQFVFNYNDLDIKGTENNMDRTGKWSNPGENTPGSWTTYSSGINLASNAFSTPATFNPADMVGDWTLAELIAFRRIFYSRQTGNWTDDQSWTANSTHSGPIFGAGAFPNIVQDSVVIGGGNLGVNNHVITLDVAGSVTIGGLALGTSPTNTGTLMTGTNIINGLHFTMGELSTLGIGSADGISSLGNSTGNIQTTVLRNFATAPQRSSFIYNGTQNQITGNGLPANVENLTIDNSGIVNDNTVLLQSSPAVEGDLNILQGIADINTQTVNSTGTGAMNISANARLKISGTNDLTTSVNNYSSYGIDINSIIEFYGTTQTISNLPANLISGFGYCVLNNLGNKSVTTPLLIRKDMNILNNATLDNQIGVNSLTVYGSIINDANIENKGIIQIGN